MKKRSSKYCLVLAGGGSKGAYQLGAWKAMKELGIEFEAVVGVSIGSINGALVAMDDFDGAARMWDSIEVGKGVNISEELPEPDNLFSRANWPALLREILKNGGIDASPAKEFFSGYIDEEKVRKSKVNYGLITVDVKNSEPLQLFRDDIPDGQLLDFVLASASVPLTKNVGPEGGRFLDGGAYDNLPLNFVRSNGYNRLIVVDIATIRGVAHDGRLENSEAVYIRPYDPDALGASFDFSAEMNEKRVKMGYLDTLRAFSCYLGKIYCFEPETFRSMAKKYGAATVEQLEELAYRLGLETLKVYGEKEFIREVKALYEEDKLKKAEKKAKKPDQQETAEKTESGEPAEKEKPFLPSEFFSRFASALSFAKESDAESGQRVSSALQSIVRETSKKVREVNDDRQGLLRSLIDRFAEGIEAQDAAVEAEPEDEREAHGAISSILGIMRSKRKSEADLSLAKEFLEEIE